MKSSRGGVCNGFDGGGGGGGDLCCLRACLVLFRSFVQCVHAFFSFLFLSYDNFDAQEDRGAYSSSAYAYDGATFGTGGIGGGGAGNAEARGAPQEADL